MTSVKITYKGKTAVKTVTDPAALNLQVQQPRSVKIQTGRPGPPGPPGSQGLPGPPGPGSNIISVFGRIGAVVSMSGDYDTSQVTENSNLYFTDIRAIAAPITGYVSGSGLVLATDTLLQAIQKLNGNIALKYDASNPNSYITSSGAPVQSVFSRTGVVVAANGDYNSSQITENTNLYFTEARVRNSLLTGLNITGGSIVASDSVLQAFGKLQNQISTIVSGVSSVFTRTGAVVAANGDYNSSQITENTNLYFTNARTIAAPITGYVSGAGTVAATDTILQAIQKLNGNILLKYDTSNPNNYISSAGAPVQSVFTRTGAVVATSGDYNSSQVTEVTNLYYTDARAIAAPITGYVSGAGTVAATDTILQAINKLNGNTALKVNSTRNINTTSPIQGGGDLSGDRTISWNFSAAGNVWQALQTFRLNGLLATISAGVYLQNQSVAAAGLQQNSPAFVYEGQGWKTTATAASQSVILSEYLVPVQGTTAPSFNITQSYNIGAAGEIISFQKTGDGNTTALVVRGPGLAVGNAAAVQFQNSSGTLLGAITAIHQSGQFQMGAANGYYTVIFSYGLEKMRVRAYGVSIGEGTTAGTTPIEPTAILLLGASNGSASHAPLKFTTGTLLSTAEAGTAEYDAVNLYFTNETTSGRGRVPIEQMFKLDAAGSTISTIANYFGTTSNIPLVANAYYEIDIYMFYLKTTAGTHTISLVNSAAPTAMDLYADFSPATGITSTPTAGLNVQVYNSTSVTQTIVTASLTDAVNHFAHIKVFLRNGSGTSLKIQSTAGAGTITPGIGSRWTSKRIAAANVGLFAT